jgi:hypothetical protein
MENHNSAVQNSQQIAVVLVERQHDWGHGDLLAYE